MPRHEIHPASGRTYEDRKAIAIAMRLENRPNRVIAKALRIGTGTVSKWVRHLPNHAGAVIANHAALCDRRRLYPIGTDALRRKLAREGFDRAERIVLLQRAAEARPELRP